MISLAKAIATVCGIGYINNGRGAGTLASVFLCILWFLIPPLIPGSRYVFFISILSAGFWSSTILEKAWGRDNNKIVIDEVAGMMIPLLFIPLGFKYIMTALFLFRFFDILKPLGIKKLERLPCGLGVMADDVAAGIYSLLMIRLLALLNLF